MAVSGVPSPFDRGKATWNVDGQPWLTTPILRADGTTCSPFVVLEA